MLSERKKGTKHPPVMHDWFTARRAPVPHVTRRCGSKPRATYASTLDLGSKTYEKIIKKQKTVYLAKKGASLARGVSQIWLCPRLHGTYTPVSQSTYVYHPRDSRNATAAKMHDKAVSIAFE